MLSLVIWTPIFAGLAVLAVGDNNQRAARVLALLGAFAGLLVALVRPLDCRIQCQLPPGYRWHFAALDSAELCDDGHRGDRRLGSHQGTRFPIHGVLPDSVRIDERRVLCT